MPRMYHADGLSRWTCLGVGKDARPPDGIPSVVYIEPPMLVQEIRVTRDCLQLSSTIISVFTFALRIFGTTSFYLIITKKVQAALSDELFSRFPGRTRSFCYYRSLVNLLRINLTPASSILVLSTIHTMPPRITSRALSTISTAQSSAGSSSALPSSIFSLSQHKPSPSLQSFTLRHFGTLLAHPRNPSTASLGWRVSRRIFVFWQYLTDDAEIISFFSSSSRFCKRPIRCPRHKQRRLFL